MHCHCHCPWLCSALHTSLQFTLFHFCFIQNFHFFMLREGMTKQSKAKQWNRTFFYSYLPSLNLNSFLFHHISYCTYTHTKTNQNLILFHSSSKVFFLYRKNNFFVFLSLWRTFFFSKAISETQNWHGSWVWESVEQLWAELSLPQTWVWRKEMTNTHKRYLSPFLSLIFYHRHTLFLSPSPKSSLVNGNTSRHVRSKVWPSFSRSFDL